jgi:Cdc6-like AAA superfamily ATPase
LPESADVIKEFENFVKNKNIIVCLDEVDQLEDPDKLLYILADSVGLILISNQSYVNLYRLNQRTRDRLGLTEVEFPEYTPDELFDIGKDRVQLSFMPGTLPDQLIRIAAMMSLGDARVLLRTLRNAGRLAEERGKKKVTIEEIKEGAKEARKLRKSRALAKLNEHQKIIYNILDEKREMLSGDLYREYKTRVSNPVGPRGFRKYMSKIVALGLAVAKGGKGRYRKYEITI